MLMLALRLILKGKGGKQHCLPYVGSNLGVDIFLKKREHQKRMHWNRGLRHLCILCIGVSRKFDAKAYLLFNCFTDYLISLICLTMARIQEKDIHQGYCQNVLWGASSSLLGVKSPPSSSIPSSIALDRLFLA